MTAIEAFLGKNPTSASMRVLSALPGLHRYDRGAELRFVSIAVELARAGDLVSLTFMMPSSHMPKCKSALCGKL